MANHKSALKRIRQNKKRMHHNIDRISRIRTFIKKFVASLGGANAADGFVRSQSEIQKGVSKGVLHPNTASRKVSRLHKMLKSTEPR
ncbi:MAG: 30S ribosomal protein S20 [Holosporaceae bacterium]|jgi:small subunit ribosomal protein S20|nr:30S ribosomal protein S20 [Holosporaceae bacterium]